MTWFLVVMCVLLAGGYWPLFRWSHRRAVDLLDQTAFGQLSHFKAECQTLAAQVEQARMEAQTASDQKSRYFAKITEIEQEMNGWKRLYQEQSIGHSNAQALMMRTIDHLGSLLRRNNVKYEMPAVLRELSEDFQNAHENPELQPKPTTAG